MVSLFVYCNKNHSRYFKRIESKMCVTCELSASQRWHLRAWVGMVTMGPGGPQGRELAE